MAVAFQSVQTAAWSNATSRVVTKPASLAVGDLMIAQYVVATGYGATHAPSGFTSLGTQIDGATQTLLSLYYKIADSGDVAATDFTFSTDNLTSQFAAIMRITGFTAVSAFKYNSGNITNTATPSIAAGITPDRADGLLLMFWGSSTSTTNTSTYAIATSNPTWTEGYDADDGGNRQTSFAYASRPQVTATGNVSCAGGNGTTDWAVQLLEIDANPIITVAESVTLTDGIQNNISSNVVESVALTETVTTTKPKWLNTDKSSSTWVNQDKS